MSTAVNHSPCLKNKAMPSCGVVVKRPAFIVGSASACCFLSSYLLASFSHLTSGFIRIQQGYERINELLEVMTTPPDISSLSLSSRPSHQRLHDTYDYEGNTSGNVRSPYQFSTSPPIPAQSQYNQLGINQSPLKNKPLRGGLPTVRHFFF